MQAEFLTNSETTACTQKVGPISIKKRIINYNNNQLFQQYAG